MCCVVECDECCVVEYVEVVVVCEIDCVCVGVEFVCEVYDCVVFEWCFGCYDLVVFCDFVVGCCGCFCVILCVEWIE